MQDITISLFQSNLHWHQPEANLAMFEEKIWGNSHPTDLIVLPEMFTSGFTMEATEQAEPMGTRTFKWMQLQAKQSNAAILGSYIVKDHGHYFNRAICVIPDGNYWVYDKRHLFRMAGEHETFQQGIERTVFSWKGWNIFPQICYDLRFPVWSRNRLIAGNHEFDLLVYLANWPAPRISAWDILLKARAIENASYCVGVNRVGADGNGIEYCGHTAAIDPKGTLLGLEEDNEAILNITLSKQDLVEYRERFPVHLDADKFTLER